MTEIDRVHAAALEVAETVVARLSQHEPESAILLNLDHLRALLVRLTEIQDDEGRPR